MFQKYYFDIETTGIDATSNKIITIQYAPINDYGNPMSNLIILKEWEEDEETILKKFIQKFDLQKNQFDKYKKFSFIPCGYNLSFERIFILEKCKKYDIMPRIDLFDLPSLDLKPIGIMANNGRFKGSGLDKLTKKSSNGSVIPILYKNKQYDELTRYIHDESKSFIEWYSYWTTNISYLQSNFKSGFQNE